jgi:predicted amidohydrolase YtcJ
MRPSRVHRFPHPSTAGRIETLFPSNVKPVPSKNAAAGCPVAQNPCWGLDQGPGLEPQSLEEGIGIQASLDTISTDHPIYRQQQIIDASWANSMALQQPASPTIHQTHGASIDRDSHGEPTVIRWNPPHCWLNRLIPQPDEKQMQSACRKARNNC